MMNLKEFKTFNKWKLKSHIGLTANIRRLRRIYVALSNKHCKLSQKTNLDKREEVMHSVKAHDYLRFARILQAILESIEVDSIMPPAVGNSGSGVPEPKGSSLMTRTPGVLL